jgi:GNAT superfamily N-acetyltransferase
VRPRVQADDAAIAAIISHLCPDLPPVPTDRLRRYGARRAESGHHEAWVATRRGEVHGWLRLTHLVDVRPVVTYVAAIQVLAEYRRQGIGTALYLLLLRRLIDTGAEQLVGLVREGDSESLRFVQQRGFLATAPRERDWRLAVEQAGLPGRTATEDRLHAAGVRIARLADLPPDAATRDAVHALAALTRRDVPHRRDHLPRIDEQWNDFLFGGENVQPEWSWVALAGIRPVGVAYVNRVAETAAANQYTGVHREYRGRGIAWALKARVVEWARTSGVDWLYTGNDALNTRMLAINARMGYEPLPSVLTCVKTLDLSMQLPE